MTPADEAAVLSALDARSPVFDVHRGLCKVVDVYDGDTCTVLTMYPGMTLPVRHRLRLFGIDAPEIRANGARAREALRDLALGKIASFEVRGKDKYGRMLASLHIDGTDVASEMIRRGLAVAYDGGAKTRVTKS